MQNQTKKELPKPIQDLLKRNFIQVRKHPPIYRRKFDCAVCDGAVMTNGEFLICKCGQTWLGV